MIQILKYHETILIFYVEYKNIFDHLLTKLSSGISNLYYAFIMVEKGSDPNHDLMEEGIFRVFKDKDGLSVNTTWSRATQPKVNNNNFYNVFSSAK